MPTPVDIIIPTYNPKTYIMEAIESCFAQTYRNFLVTVIDDCSTTDTSFILKEFPRVNFLRTDKNGGPAYARNYGIKRTTAPIISFLDDDDIMTQSKLLWSVQALEKDPTIGLVCGNYRILINRRKVLNPFYKRAPTINWSTLMRVNQIACGSVSIRREIIEKIGGFDERFFIGEDFGCWLRAAEISQIKYLHRVLYLYSRCPGGGSLSDREDIQAKHSENLRIIKEESAQRMKLKNEPVIFPTK